MEILFFLIVAAAIYLIPTFIALARKHTYRVAIVLTSIVGGLVGAFLYLSVFFLFIGVLVWVVCWLVTLIWCFVDPKKAARAAQQSDSAVTGGGDQGQGDR